MARARKAPRRNAKSRPSKFGPGSAVRRPAAIVLFVSIAAVGLAADLWSKHAVFQWLLNDPSALQPDGRVTRPVLPGVSFTLNVNPGVVFGWKGLPPWAVGLATALTIVLVLYFFASSDGKARVVHAALAMVLAGALGNFHDRMFSSVRLPGTPEPIRHHVRDFIDCSALHYPWTFNVADVLLVVGVAVLMVLWLFGGAGEKKAPPGKDRAK